MKVTERLKRSLALFVAAIGLLSSIITTLTANFTRESVQIGLIVMLMAAFVMIGIIYFLPKDSLPQGLESVADAIVNNDSDQHIKIIFPCDKFYYKAANALAKEKFGKGAANTNAANDWQKRNEYILTCLTDHNIMVGYFDILPLKTDFALRFINGEVAEKDIRAEHLYGFHEIKKAEYVYFAGIAVKNPSIGLGCIHATYLVYAAILYLQTFYKGGNLKKVLTIPTSPEGLAIAQKFFTLEREGNFRKDSQDLYATEVSAAFLEKIVTKKRNVYKRFDASAYSNLLAELN